MSLGPFALLMCEFQGNISHQSKSLGCSHILTFSGLSPDFLISECKDFKKKKKKKQLTKTDQINLIISTSSLGLASIPQEDAYLLLFSLVSQDRD